LPLYPLQVDQIKSRGNETDLVLKDDYLYVSSGKYIEVFDLRNPEKPNGIYEYEDKGKNFVSLKIHNNYLFALYEEGKKDYGLIIFQIE